MRYSSITGMDFNNGEGARVSIFLQGCRIHCKGCFNKSAWDFNGGKEITIETMDKLVELLNNPYCDGLTILGGEPLDQNLHELNTLIAHIRLFCPDKTIWMYTGHLWENLIGDKAYRETVSLVDVLVDGPFKLSEKSEELPFRGSSNQRIIAVKESLKAKKLKLIYYIEGYRFIDGTRK